MTLVCYNPGDSLWCWLPTSLAELLYVAYDTAGNIYFFQGKMDTGLKGHPQKIRNSIYVFFHVHTGEKSQTIPNFFKYCF